MREVADAFGGRTLPPVPIRVVAAGRRPRMPSGAFGGGALVCRVVTEPVPLSPLTRVLIGPPGWVLLPVVGVAAVALLHAVSVPGGDLIWGFFGSVVAFCAVVVWAPRFVVALLRSDGRPGLRRHWVRWAAAPVMGVAVVASAYSGLAGDVRFALSESGLEAYAREVAAGGETGWDERSWVGLYPLERAEPLENGGARFVVSDTGFLNRYGFAWSPKGPPEEGTGGGYEHIRGPWYVWEEEW